MKQVANLNQIVAVAINLKNTTLRLLNLGRFRRNGGRIASGTKVAFTPVSLVGFTGIAIIVDVFEDADYIPNPRDYYGLENPQNIQLAINNTDDMMSPYYIELYDDEY